MSESEDYIEMCKNYNFENAKAYLTTKEISDIEVIYSHIDDLFTEINFREIKLSKKELRKVFFQNMCTYFEDGNVTKYITDKLSILEYIEASIQEVENIRDNHDFYKNDKAKIIYSLINGFGEILSKQLCDMQVFDENLSMEDNLKKVNELDGLLPIFSNTLTLNLKFIAYSEKWFVDEFLQLPNEDMLKDNNIIASDEEINFAIIITNFWIFIENKYTEWRYLDNKLSLHHVQDLKKQLSNKDFRNISKKHNYYLRCCISPIHPYAYIAQMRLSRMLNNQSIQAHQILSSSKNPMGVEDIEINTSISTLCNILHVKPTTKFGELTIKEWVVCFFSLNMEARNNSRQRLYMQEDFKSIFPKTITSAQRDYFINTMSFKKNTLDMFDAPLIKTISGGIIFLSEFWYATNHVNMFLSITGKNNIKVDKKGKAFEVSIIDFFKRQKKLGLDVFEFKIKVDGNEFQYDAIVVWEEYVFIIECKNRSILNTTTNSMKDFVKKADDYIQQVKRLEEFYKSNISIFNEKFKMNLNGKNVVSVVLNALPFSLDSDTEGVYFLDYSILSKFFETKKLGKRNLSTNELEEIVFDWWSGETPKANDLYEVIKSPFQITSEIENIEINHNFFEIGDFLFLRDLISLESEPMIEFKKN